MARILVCVIALGCAKPDVIRNHVERWDLRELCLAIPAHVGRDGPVLEDVRYVGTRVESTTMNGTTHDVWRASTPRPFHEVGVESFAGVPIAAWVETSLTLRELCEALGLVIDSESCWRSHSWGLVIGGIVAHAGRARLTCIHRVGPAMR